LTFVFTDIEGSTRLVTELASSYGLALRIHRQMLKNAFDDFGGRQIGSEGDGLFCYFPSPGQAVEASVAAQQKIEHYDWPEDLRLRVRMGIHHGPVRMSGGEYVGLTVHEVSRICSAAHGGQILCSAAVARALGDATDDVRLLDLGAFSLRGIPEARTLYQVCASGLEDTFPPPRDAVRDGGTRVTIWRREPPRRGTAIPESLPIVSPDDVEVEIAAASSGISGSFRVVVRRRGVVEEEYDGLTVGGVADAATVVNAHSTLIRIETTD